ncbi:fimbrial protein [Pseudomonas rubra]|uniref:Fimbrial protein n=1 Tax=Pseudomonas rubra TaxID=2942627 RepID=A0ABT5P9K5_9PSED|nr:fimbrial protein [Pseudomonas rubra]MDD1014981.1 fimbrial protein [Pseudomonas rubra]MDD1038102.1 fimbrial protein [Pseudomonas rubra]MDD1156615.1 fimbrial protein [Pseudomonas rubra]
MKKLTFSGLFAALTLAGVTQLAQAADGEISFEGFIVNSTCAIEIGDSAGGVRGVVKLGDEVPTSSLSSAGMVAGGGYFNLQVNSSDPGCDVSGKSATVTFLPVSGSVGPSGQWLALENVAGAATNVAVQLRDRRGIELPMSEASEEYVDLTQPMRFTANYIATGTATPGPANAKALFTVNIQ